MFRMCEAAVTVEVEEAVTEYQFSFPDFLVFVGGDTVRACVRQIIKLSGSFLFLLSFLKRRFLIFKQSSEQKGEDQQQLSDSLCVCPCVCVCVCLHVCLCAISKMRILVLLPDHEKRRIKSEVKCPACIF